jgi:hypothetical protein
MGGCATEICIAACILRLVKSTDERECEFRDRAG